MAQPQVFIGSSSEEIDTARQIAVLLEDEAFPRVWKDSQVFALGTFTVEALLAELDHFDFAVFVLSKDDLVRSRKHDSLRARDNVVFEAGMFMGRLGRERTFLVAESGVILPSDIAGMNVAFYTMNPADSVASVGTACTKVRNAMAKAQKTAQHEGPWLHVTCHLSKEEYKDPTISVDRSFSPVNIRVQSDSTSKFEKLHICYPDELELFFTPWDRKRKPASDHHAPDYWFYWLTPAQLVDLHSKPKKGLNFLVRGKTPGNYKIRLIAESGDGELDTSIGVHVD